MTRNRTPTTNALRAECYKNDPSLTDDTNFEALAYLCLKMEEQCNDLREQLARARAVLIEVAKGNESIFCGWELARDAQTVLKDV